MTSARYPKSLLLVVAAQLGLLLFFIYYTFVGGQTALGVYDDFWRRLTLYLMTALLGGWLGWRLLGRSSIPRTPLDGPLLALAASWLLAAIFSQNSARSWETLVFWLTYLFVYFMAVDLGRRRWFKELALNAIVAVSGFVLAFALLQLSWWWRDQPAGFAPLSLPRLSVLGNPNTMASFLALVFPLVLYKLSAAKTLAGQILGIAWLGLLAAATLLTQSRGGLLALGAAGGFFVAIWAGRSTQKNWWRWGLPLLGLAVLAGLVVIGLTMRSLSGGISIRQQVMTGALITWWQHPLVGSGPGTLGQELLQNQPVLEKIWPDAHNLYLTLLAETGLAGAIGLVWLAVVALRQLWTDVNQGTDLPGVASAAALVGFAAHSLVDSQLKYPAIMLLVAVLAGFWMSARPLEERQRWGRWAAAGGMVVLLALFVVGWRSVQAVETYNRAVEAALAGDWQTAVARLQVVQQQSPADPFLQRQLAFAAGMLAGQVPDRREQAIELYRLALASVDRLAVDHANLGCLLRADGQPGAATGSFQQAGRLEPNRLLYPFVLSYYFGQPDTAVADGLDLAASGKLAEATHYFERAFKQMTMPLDDGRYATEVARRRPLPSSALPCLQTAASAALVEITLAEGQILGDGGDFRQAAQVYRRLLAIEPAAEVQSALNALCRNQSQSCDSEN